jgi:hypothetical protein
VVLTLVERGGDARVFAVKDAKARTLLAQIAGNVGLTLWIEVTNTLNDVRAEKRASLKQ